MQDLLDEINGLQDRDVERLLDKGALIWEEMRQSKDLKLSIPLAIILRDLCNAAESPLNDMLDIFDDITRR